MASPDVTELTDTNFDAEILKATTPAVVDFWALWCKPCLALGPTVETLAAEYRGRVKVGKMNVDDHQNVAQRYQIRGLPTLLFFKGGQPIDQITGNVSRAKIEERIKKLL